MPRVGSPLGNANRYLNLIRNIDKRRYGFAYLTWLRNGAVGLEPERGRLSVMGAQAVRIQLHALLGPEPFTAAQENPTAQLQRGEWVLIEQKDYVTRSPDYKIHYGAVFRLGQTVSVSRDGVAKVVRTVFHTLPQRRDHRDFSMSWVLPRGDYTRLAHVEFLSLDKARAVITKFLARHAH